MMLTSSGVRPSAFCRRMMTLGIAAQPGPVRIGPHFWAILRSVAPVFGGGAVLVLVMAFDLSVDPSYTPVQPPLSRQSSWHAE